MRAPRYVPSAETALEVILWFAHSWPGIDVYHLAKAAFYADKHHVSNYGRPIVGDQYEAAPYGPLPQVIYGLIKHDPIELLALGSNGPLPDKASLMTCRSRVRDRSRAAKKPTVKTPSTSFMPLWSKGNPKPNSRMKAMIIPAMKYNVSSR